MSILSALRTQVRQRADMVNSEFVSDSELNQYINDSYKELYDLLVTKFEDYFIADPYDFTISSGNTASLPTDFYKVRGVDRQNSSSDYFELYPFNFNDRNRSGGLMNAVYSNGAPRYRVLDTKIHFTPSDDAAGTYRLWYIPTVTTLSSDTDAVLTQAQPWEIYIVTDAAIKCLQKEESDVSVLMAQKAELVKRIEEASANRDAGLPSSVTDVYSSANFPDWPRWR